MKKIQTYLPYIIILGLCLMLFLSKECGSPDSVKYIPVVKTVTKVIPVKYDKYYPAPYPEFGIDSFEVPVQIDTSKVVKNYYKLNLYHRKLVDDSNGVLDLWDSITQNKVRGYRLSGKMNRFEIITTNTIQEPKRNKVFVGIMVGSNLQSFSIIPKFSLLTKKEGVYEIGYDPFSNTGYVGYNFKIKVW